MLSLIAIIVLLSNDMAWSNDEGTVGLYKVLRTEIELPANKMDTNFLNRGLPQEIYIVPHENLPGLEHADSKIHVLRFERLILL